MKKPLRKKNILSITKNIFLSFFLLTMPVCIWAWNQPIHVLIAEIAYHNLTPDHKIKVNSLADEFFYSLSKSSQDKLTSKFPNASTFAKLAGLPDTWRDYTLKDIYRIPHAQLPMNLVAYATHTTGTWHYIDIPFPNSKTCDDPNPINIVWALDKITHAFESSKDAKSKAASLIFIAHFMGDIHQPLHAITNVSHNCESDHGGNSFCLRQTLKGKCKLNLHSLWDSGAGYVKGKINIQQYSYELQNIFPRHLFTKELTIKDPAQWAIESHQQANFVYSTPEFTHPMPIYFENAQQIAKYRIAVAAYRMANYLNSVL